MIPFTLVSLDGDLAERLALVPTSAGVAQIVGPEGKNLLVGRAANLRRWAASHLGAGRPPAKGKRPPTDLRPVATGVAHAPTSSPFQQKLVYERLLARYQGKVLRLAMSYLGSRSDAEDLAQEAFVRVWRALPSYDGRASLSTWIYVITRNACLSELQRRKRRPTSPLDEAAEPRPHEGRPTTPPSDTRLDCDALLRTLPETQRQVVALFYLEERSYEQVAALLDMPLNTVRSHLHRARRHLALALGGRK